MIESGDIMTEAHLKAALKTGAVRVEFIKADGSRRVMTATQDIEVVKAMAPSKVPVSDPAKPKRVDPPGLFTVFDIDEKDWRRFKYDTIVQTVVCKDEVSA